MYEVQFSNPGGYKKFIKSNFSKLIIFVVFVGIIFLAGYFFLQYQKTQALLKNPNQATAEEATQLVMRVGKLIELPTSENPTIATVSDVTKLVDQPFFSKAQNGDKVLVYTQNKMLILFRPSLNKIITVGTVNAAPTITANPTVTVTPTISAAPTITSKPTLTPTVTPLPAQ